MGKISIRTNNGQSKRVEDLFKDSPYKSKSEFLRDALDKGLDVIETERVEEVG